MRSIRRLLAPLRIRRRQQRGAVLADKNSTNKTSKILSTASRLGYDHLVQTESSTAGESSNGGRGTTISDETSSTEGSSSEPSSPPWKAGTC
jgi:hypothetical protein